MNKEDLAFPYTDFDENHKGLTKREYIATKVLAGMFVGYSNGFPDKQIICKSAIEFTDELLKQLSK